MQLQEIQAILKNTLQLLKSLQEIDDQAYVIRTGIQGTGQPKYYFLVLKQKIDGHYIPKCWIKGEVIKKDDYFSYFDYELLAPTNRKHSKYFDVNKNKTFWTRVRYYQDQYATLKDFFGDANFICDTNHLLTGIKPQAIQALLNISPATPNYQVLLKDDNDIHNVVFKVGDFVRSVMRQSNSSQITITNYTNNNNTIVQNFSNRNLSLPSLENNVTSIPSTISSQQPSTFPQNTPFSFFAEKPTLSQPTLKANQANALPEFDRETDLEPESDSTNTYYELLQQYAVLKKLLNQTKQLILQHPEHKQQEIFKEKLANVSMKSPKNVANKNVSMRTKFSTVLNQNELDIDGITQDNVNFRETQIASLSNINRQTNISTPRVISSQSSSSEREETVKKRRLEF